MSNSAKASSGDPNAYWEPRAFVYGAIILSYASLEAALNEILHLHALAETSPLNAADRKTFHVIRQEGLQPRERSNTLAQYNMLLRILGKPIMETGANPYQAANLVRTLRNMLVHPNPGRVVTFVENDDFDYSSQQDIVKRLKSPLGLKTNATFPADVITSKCATWAVGACEAFLHAFVIASGISPGFVTDPSK